MRDWDPEQLSNYLDAIMRVEEIPDDAELGRRSGINQTQIGRWRRGEARPSAQLLTKLAEALSVPASNLFVLAGYPISSETATDTSVIPPEIRDLIALYNDPSIGDEFRELIRSNARMAVHAIRGMAGQPEPAVSRRPRRRAS